MAQEADLINLHQAEIVHLDVCIGNGVDALTCLGEPCLAEIAEKTAGGLWLDNVVARPEQGLSAGRIQRVGGIARV